MNYVPIVRCLLLLLAAVMLLFGAVDRLVPRAHYVDSDPKPGSVLSRLPSAVTITFSNELAPQSEISIASTITLTPSGELLYADGKTFSTLGPDSRDTRRLRVDLDPGLGRGLYWVKWNAVAARGKAQRFGRLCFAVGMPFPTHITSDTPGGLMEWNYRFRDYRSVWLGGVFLLGLGILLPRLTRPDHAH